MTTYHIGLLKGSGPTLYWRNGHHKTTVIIQARRNLDSLSPDLWKYCGERHTTKHQLRRYARSGALVAAINRDYATSFNRVVID